MAKGATLEAARAAKRKTLTALGNCAELNGVGITRVEDGYAVKVNLAAEVTAGGPIPEEVDGVPVVVEVVGRISKRNSAA